MAKRKDKHGAQNATQKTNDWVTRTLTKAEMK